MTYLEVKDAVLTLSIEDMVKLKRELADMIFYEARKMQPPCPHPADKRYEQRRGDRSVDVICRACGGLLEYRE
jgi:hypothetical protein